MEIRIATEPGDRTRPNEDFYIALPALVGVFDGVSAPSGLDTGCVHGTSWYTRRLATAIGDQYTTRPNAPLPEIVADAIHSVACSHLNTCDLAHPGTPQSTIALVRLNDDRLDYLILSDATLVADQSGHITVVTDLRLKGVAQGSRITAFDGTAPLGSVRHAAQIRNLALAKRASANTASGYWIAAADPEAAHHAVTGSLPLTTPGAVNRFALLTDGASCVVDAYQLMGWSSLLALAHSTGPQAVIDAARAAEDDDPGGGRRRRLKHHDDATIVYGTLTAEVADA